MDVGAFASEQVGDDIDRRIGPALPAEGAGGRHRRDEVAPVGELEPAEVSGADVLESAAEPAGRPLDASFDGEDAAGPLGVPRRAGVVVDPGVVGEVAPDVVGQRGRDADAAVGHGREDAGDGDREGAAVDVVGGDLDDGVGPRLQQPAAVGQRFRDDRREPERLVVLAATGALGPVRLVVPGDARRGRAPGGRRC